MPFCPHAGDGISAVANGKHLKVGFAAVACSIEMFGHWNTLFIGDVVKVFQQTVMEVSTSLSDIKLMTHATVNCIHHVPGETAKGTSNDPGS